MTSIQCAACFRMASTPALQTIREERLSTSPPATATRVLCNCC
uniref:Uncharacterized protein n=1 Tax=Anguilla anguilla TaxID=7936 RepID=A0A0E9SN56_ANGAN